MNGLHRILVVEDEPSLRRLVARTVQSALPQCSITEAADGLEAAGLLETLTPSVVIMDLRMPGMDGFELCRLIRQRWPDGPATVIAMTGETTAHNVDEIRRAGAAACLLKPFDLDELVGHVQAALTHLNGATSTNRPVARG